ncbi:hypothetical protein C3941_02595 [Kaistia algarum]|uniref:MarR family transcriptional regulator n=1 Tax=Kaistia algarum TaxID=2083279 RepID=UPI000CE8C580|nr:MarR family transcriptional regulator [Kaistia algarum]MCX5512896.1 MarR family transcriptional regulator [Kaistia algarum]PPE81615.1 hypothetical protein C3941_02595 [Kaistia algarum]
MDETAGIAAVARMLSRLADAPGGSVAELATELGIGRSTAFAVVAELDAAGLVERDAGGVLMPGIAGGRLGLARFGFGGIATGVEALLPILRDDTDASAFLVLRDDDSELIVATRRAPWDSGGESPPRLVETTIGRSGLGFTCALRLGLRPNASEGEVRSATACLERVAACLSSELMKMRRG